jgi:hypothetical protein
LLHRASLQGFRLTNQVYELLEPDAEDRLTSAELGLCLKAVGSLLRLVDAASGQPLLTKDERIAE